MSFSTVSVSKSIYLLENIVNRLIFLDLKLLGRKHLFENTQTRDLKDRGTVFLRLD